jgi:hypothetical protein
MASGESVPVSAEMFSGELQSPAWETFDPEFVSHAASAVFYHFKHDLGRQTVSVGEFTLALEKVLQEFAGKTPPASPKRSDPLDLGLMASESGAACELFFFPRLRDELRTQLRSRPKVVQFLGLRRCVKQLAGAHRWCARCQTLSDHIIEYLRSCLTAEPTRTGCTLVVE